MTDQERSIMAELEAACETCVEEITDLLRRIPQPYTGEMSNRIRAARHLARRAIENAERGLSMTGTLLFEIRLKNSEGAVVYQVVGDALDRNELLFDPGQGIRVGNRLLTGFVFAPSVKEITPDPGASTEIGAE